MTAAPKAISHGLGAAAGAAFGAFAGMSAANAGAAIETASAAATDNTTFFIESAPLNRSARSRAGPLHTSKPRIGVWRTLAEIKSPRLAVPQDENDSKCCLFRRFGPLSTKRWPLLRECHKWGLSAADKAWP